jgi:hypothetical protein
MGITCDFYIGNGAQKSEITAITSDFDGRWMAAIAMAGLLFGGDAGAFCAL